MKSRKEQTNEPSAYTVADTGTHSRELWAAKRSRQPLVRALAPLCQDALDCHFRPHARSLLRQPHCWQLRSGHYHPAYRRHQRVVRGQRRAVLAQVHRLEHTTDFPVWTPLRRSNLFTLSKCLISVELLGMGVSP